MDDKDLDEIQTDIDEKYEEIQEANYYEILGVDENVDRETISKEFRKLAKKWHADRFKSFDLSEDRQQKVQEISSELNNAHRTLSSPKEREDYDQAREAEDIDVGSVVDAESAFRRGRNLLDAGRNEGAHKQFEEAVELSPEEEPEYRAHYLYTEYLLISKTDAGDPKDRERASEIFREMDGIADTMQNRRGWLYAYMGVVAQGLNRRDEAESLFREALQIDRDNTLAQRQLRLIQMRENNDQDEGFFSKILSKLNLA
ncbi:MAG: DnaJ domain-containing protein [Bradymonadaceae bacterium]